jgi:NAD(P)-dependent dehydrogenase (short-subunit alcohol dehydrogenase family)
MTTMTDRKIVLLTGATDGLGRAMARELGAADNVSLIVHGRNLERAESIAAELRAKNPSVEVFAYAADLASLAEVRELARAIDRDFPRLDVLLNNAGIGSQTGGAQRQTSADGYELRFAVNYLAPFLLTNELLATLRESPTARIVNVASVGQTAVDFDDVMLTSGYDGTRAYCQSKLAQIEFTFELAGRFEAEGVRNVTVNALHPASLMPTKIVYESFGYTMSTLEEGVRATVRLALDPALEGVSGRYYDGLDEARADAQAYDTHARRKLWKLSESLVRDAFANVTDFAV